MKDYLHLRAPGNWINDPNGFIYYKGQYHLFFQYFPYAPFWGTMHWGHAVSDDLIHWEHKGIALLPSKPYDRNGVFSGSAVEQDGRMYLYYTAVRYDEENPENIHKPVNDRFTASQAMLISEDGVHFDNWKAKRQIIPPITDPEKGDHKDTRDPKVWRQGNAWYMVLGSTRNGTGRLLVYRSDDGLHWTYGNQCVDPAFGTTLECPDLMPLGDGMLLFGCPMHVTMDGLKYPDQATYARADFDPDSCQVTLREKPRFLDWGLDLYAPQSTLDREGRRVWIGWMRMPAPVTDPTGSRADWCGMMSLPRLVELRDGEVCFPVHPAVPACFDRPAKDLSPLAEHRPVRLQGTLREGESWNVGGYRIRMREGRIETDRSEVFGGLENCRLTAQTPSVGAENCRLDVYATENLIEIFVNEGRYVLSQIVYGLGQTLEGNFDALSTAE